MKSPDEWFKQSDYDLETAKAMFKAGRYIYTVFMCHLSIEKALKGLYTEKYQENPPKIHNLNYFCEKNGLKLPGNLQNFIDNLNNLSVPTRYPDELEKLLRDYKKDLTEGVYNQTKELLLWLKQKKSQK
ncbi:TPA: DNA-binding protein [bacterium]|nr:DNA-binding protein [bacterium]